MKDTETHAKKNSRECIHKRTHLFKAIAVDFDDSDGFLLLVLLSQRRCECAHGAITEKEATFLIALGKRLPLFSKCAEARDAQRSHRVK